MAQQAPTPCRQGITFFTIKQLTIDIHLLDHDEHTYLLQIKVEKGLNYLSWCSNTLFHHKQMGRLPGAAFAIRYNTPIIAHTYSLNSAGQYKPLPDPCPVQFSIGDSIQAPLPIQYVTILTDCSPMPLWLIAKMAGGNGGMAPNALGTEDYLRGRVPVELWAVHRFSIGHVISPRPPHKDRELGLMH